MSELSPDDLQEAVDFYEELCARIDSGMRPSSAVAALMGAIWYISPEMGLDAKELSDTFAKQVMKWEKIGS